MQFILMVSSLRRLIVLTLNCKNNDSNVNVFNHHWTVTYNSRLSFENQQFQSLLNWSRMLNMNISILWSTLQLNLLQLYLFHHQHNYNLTSKLRWFTRRPLTIKVMGSGLTGVFNKLSLYVIFFNTFYSQ